MHDMNAVFSWSLRLGQWRGTEIRASWLLGVWMLFEAVRFAQTHGQKHFVALIAVGFLAPPLVMALHAMGHAAACQLVGGRLHATTLSVINNLDEVTIPLRPWPHFFVGFAGPLVNLLVAGGCWLGAQYTSGLLAQALNFGSGINLLIGIANLLACQPFDGHRWWRGLLWACMPMRRAVKATVMLGFISAILLLLYAVNYTDYLLLFVGIMSLIATINDRMSLAQGSDPVFLVDPNYVGVAPSSGWRQRWAARAAAVTEREAAAEQEVLDRLLAKVSEHGLPSLTKAERTQLQKISRRQKDRAQAP